MRTIWKFLLELGPGWQFVSVGPGPVLLCDFDPATGQPAIWIERNPANTAKAGLREFGIFPTGGEIPDSASHCGSLIDKPRHLVWHIYERVARGDQARQAIERHGSPDRASGIQ
jgi:hypothetical protein